MSLNAMVWALGQPIGKSSLKFVLVALANYAGPNGECYPSIPRLAFDTGQDEKTVRRNLRELATQNYLVDTGRRVGRTKQIPVYILASYADYLNLNPPKNGSLPKSNPPKNGSKGYQKRTLNPPKNGTQNLLLNCQGTHGDSEKPKSVRQSEEQKERNAIHIAELLDNLGGNR